MTRFLVDGAVRKRWSGPLPAGTMFINLSGSLLLGLLTGLVLYHGAPARLTLVAGTGFCGGYTTFSTASFETVRLVQSRRGRTAATSLAVTVAGTLLAAAAGLGLAAL
ncbi:MAG: CrcB family protein [Acidobacteriota bacterium]|nr:CrcB family protein [Acidobacteriota bacterium]